VGPANRIAVFGLGYVGAVTAGCLARLGSCVVGVDRDDFKVRCVREGRAPFHEPGLEDLIREAVAAGRLCATTDPAAAVLNSEIAFICVGTPSARNGNLHLEQLERVCAEIARFLPQRADPLLVAVRSTVFPGTCEEVVIPRLGASARAVVLAHPEFLREGSAVRDFLEPSLVVVGGPNGEARERIAGLYRPLGVEPSLVELRTAEIIKYACNAFHALKIAFSNEIGTLCSSLNISGEEVMTTLCRDATLNISRAYLRPGFAFGGSCLPKDLRALVYRASRLDLKLPLAESILLSNEEHLRRATQAVLDLREERIGFFGLAFKENTDDVRESPVIALLEQLIGKGRAVRVYDPNISLDRIYGSNQRYLLTAIPHIGRLIDSRLEDLLGWAQQVVVAQAPQQAYADQIRASGLPVLSLIGQTDGI
jgi:GDP-mannose 6-dehydrogenase